MKFTIQLLALITLLIFPLLAQQNQEIQMFLDYARFRYDSTQTYLEIYYLLYGQSDQTTTNPEKFKLGFYLTDMDTDSLLAYDEFPVRLDVASDSLTSNAKGSLIKTVLPPGKYQIKMNRISLSSDQVLDSAQQDFSTVPFNDEKITLSDLELCSNILTSAGNRDDLFYKNTMAVYPNPTHIYGSESPNLYYYIELYNIGTTSVSDTQSVLDKNATTESNGKLEIQVAIKDDQGKIHDKKNYKRDRNHESLVEQGRFNVSDLHNGIYTLMFAVIDPQSEYSVYRLNNFQIANQDEVVSAEVDVMSYYPESIYYNMPEEVVDKRFEQADYVMTKKQKHIYESLDSVEPKRQFMYKFWHEKEKNYPDYQQVYYERIDYADEHFREFGKDGWNTDRGRIYAVYGEPNESISRVSSAKDEPFKIWIYHDLEGGARFLFVDEMGFNSYRLVSSTLRDEIYDPSWDDYLNIMIEH